MDPNELSARAERDGELLRLLAENVKDYAIFVVDAERRVQTWTMGAERLLGYRESEVLGHRADMFFIEEDIRHSVPEQEIAAAVTTGRGEDDRWHVRKDGSRVWVSGAVTPLWEENGELRGFAKIMRDRTDWKLAEQARQESEGRLQTLLDRLPQGAVYQAVQLAASDDVRFTYLSAGVETIFGTSPERVMADAAILELCIPREDRQRARLSQTEHQRAGGSQEGAAGEGAAGEVKSQNSRGAESSELEFQYRSDAGVTRWVHCQSAPHRTPSGEIFWEGVMLDVTKRKEAEIALVEHEARLSLALEAGRMGTWQWNIRSNHVSWSAQLEKIHGIPVGSFPGTFEAFHRDVHPEDRDFVLAAISEAASTGKGYCIEYRLLWPDGSVHWIESRGKLFLNQAGHPEQMIGICTEITERKWTEHDLRFLAEASRSLAALVDYKSTLQRVAGLAVPHFADWCTVHIPEKQGKLRQLAVAHADPAKVHSAEELARRWASDPEMPGGPHEVFQSGKAVLIHEGDDELLQRVAGDQEHLAILRELGLKSYMCMPLMIRGEAIGVITFVAAESGRRYTEADFALAEDLTRRAAIATENARLYAKLRTDGRRKDEFLAMLAHELRNPLASIRSGTDLLSMLHIEDEVVETMQQQVEHLIRLVDDLMDVSRVMRGKVGLRKEPVELSAVVSRAVDTMHPMIESHQQQLTVNLAPEPVWVRGDPVRLTQVVTNLLNNASKYSESGGRIWLATEPQGEGVLVRVRDAGIGIDQETRQHVFDLFTQARRSLDRSQGGLGIGLTVVKSLVEGHGGNVSVHSEGPNQGSEFTVWLPTCSPPSETAAKDPLSASVPAARKVLIVDDNVPAVKMLNLLLSKIGNHQISTAYDGEAALAAARQYQPDLILLDIGLPKLDGFEVVRQLRSWPEFHHTRIVALTGYGSEEDRRLSLAAGFDEHLVKPPSSEALQALLARSHRPHQR